MTQEARGDSRNVITSATSGSGPSRPNGNWVAWKVAKSSGLPLGASFSQPPPGNRIEPGLTELTRMPSTASSWAAVAASWISAALAAA